MLRDIYRTMSLKNFFSAHASGQIATLLILLMVILLIFVLVTINVGKISLQTTVLANAADAAGLSLASQLGTKAQQLFKALGTGQIENCTKVNWLTTIFAVVAAVVLIVFTMGAGAATLPALFAACAANLGSMAATIAIGAVGGAIGGMAGAALGGTPIEKGLAQGAAIGVAVGASFVAAGSLCVATPAEGAVIPTGSTVVTDTGAIGEVVGEATYMGATISGTTMASLGATTATITGVVVDTLLTASLGAASVAISAGSELYGYNREVQATENFYSDLQKQLGGMEEDDKYKEGTFFLAFSQVVDDPRTTSADPDKQSDCDGDGTIDIGDQLDTDADGDLTEEIPCFQYWYYKRAQEIRINYAKLKELVDNFFNKTLKDFSTYAESQIFNGGALDRAAYVNAPDNAHSDGTLINWARTLEERNASLYAGNTNINITFYKSGNAAQVIGPTESSDSTSWEEFYYDEVDAVVKELAGIILVSKGLYSKMNIDQLTTTWEDWIGVFDDNNVSQRGDFYDELWLMISGADDFQGIDTWIDEIKRIRNSRPACIMGCAGVCNPTCRLPDVAGAIPGSINYDTADEFTPVLRVLTEPTNSTGLREKLMQFRADIKKFRNDMDYWSKQKGDPTKYGGVNPVTYTWNDKLGTHSVSVQIDNLEIPRIKKYKKNESWGGLVKDVCCGIVPQYGTPTITVSRHDGDVNKQIGFLGKWNPFSGTIKRTCKAYWHWDGVRYLVDMADIK